jgi:hypothetical protein
MEHAHGNLIAKVRMVDLLSPSEKPDRSGIGKLGCFVSPSNSGSNPGQGQKRLSSKKGKMRDRSCFIFVNFKHSITQTVGLSRLWGWVSIARLLSEPH